MAKKNVKGTKAAVPTDANAKGERVPAMNGGAANGESNGPTGSPARRKPAKKRDNRSTLSKVRDVVPVVVVLVCAVAFVAKVPLGNISTFGWEAISAICPVGALSVLLAGKTFVLRAVISLVIAVVLILVFGRAFCAWVCTVPLVQRTLNIRSQSAADRRAVQRERQRKEQRRKRGSTDAGTPAAIGGDEKAATVTMDSTAAPTVTSALTEDERAQIAAEMGELAGASGCAAHRAHVLDSRHAILGGGLLSAAVFGFPVFCLVCPIGLSFATVYLVLRLFTGQVSWALVVVPVMLAAELLLLRKWCYKVCPVGALMSLVGLGNRTFVPRIDEETCIETTRGKTCGRCRDVCPQGIDLHDYALGEHGINDCTKCRRCIDACPARAIKMPFLPDHGNRKV